jgi:hypothetical protein
MRVDVNGANQDTQQLLLEIARCDVAATNCEIAGPGGPCSIIVNSQGVANWKEFQVPEPWSGDLVRAPILFLSSNPNISTTEAFPNLSWDDSAILQFFNGRFQGHWIRDGKFPRNNDGTYGQAVRYWSSIRNRASELVIGRPAEPGIDFALSELVHCKSRNEAGVQSALSNCAGRYLKRLLSCSGAVVVVLVGRKALDYWNSQSLGLPNVPETEGTDFEEVAGRDRLFVFLPHPASFEVQKRFVDRISPNKMEQIRSLLCDR